MKDLEILAENISETQALMDNVKSELEAIVDKALPLEKRLAELKEENTKLRMELANGIKEAGLKKVEYMNKNYGIRETEKVYIQDNEKVMNWIKAQKNLVNKEYIRVKESLDMVKFKRFALLKIKSGEEIPETKLDTEITLVVK